MAQVTENKLRDWLAECERVGASHMLLVVNRDEDFSLSPVKVFPHENIHDVMDFYHKPETEVVEIYSMSHSIDEQLKSEVPVFNYA